MCSRRCERGAEIAAARGLSCSREETCRAAAALHQSPCCIRVHWQAVRTLLCGLRAAAARPPSSSHPPTGAPGRCQLLCSDNRALSSCTGRVNCHQLQTGILLLEQPFRKRAAAETTTVHFSLSATSCACRCHAPFRCIHWCGLTVHMKMLLEPRAMKVSAARKHPRGGLSSAPTN